MINSRIFRGLALAHMFDLVGFAGVMKRLSLAVVLVSTSALSSAVVLYDAGSGLAPQTAPWAWNYGSTGGDGVSVSGGLLHADTTGSAAVQAGWSRLSPISLSPSGVTIRFSLSIDAEDHSLPSADKNGDGLADRSGFSIIAIGSDGKGVELGFWTGEIWAQQDLPLFTHSSTLDRAFLNTTALNQYDLSFVGASYSLKANGSTILTGVRKDYSAFAGFPDPYETPNFLFFGDDTSSASGRYSLRDVSVVPEPASLVGFSLGALAFIRRSRARCQGKT